MSKTKTEPSSFDFCRWAFYMALTALLSEFTGAGEVARTAVAAAVGA